MTKRYLEASGEAQLSALHLRIVLDRLRRAVGDDRAGCSPVILLARLKTTSMSCSTNNTVMPPSASRPDNVSTAPRAWIRVH
jgi:hypothetical protein